MSATLVEALGAYTSTISTRDLPPQVKTRARQAVLDTVGAIVLGAQSDVACAVRTSVSALEGAGVVTALGTSQRLSVQGAALAGGTAAHAWELDDFGGCGHSGAVVIPAVLAAGEHLQSTGERILEAVVAGYEAAARVTAAAGGYRAQTDRGWHTTGTCGSFGAAVGVARVLGLGPETTANALGIAGSFVGGIWSFVEDGAMTKRVHAGQAAATGLMAAFLAQQGISGPRWVLEAEWGGMFSTYMDGHADAEEITRGLGEDFRILESGIKVYAACRGNHFPIDALTTLVDTNGIAVEEIDEILLHVPEQTARQLGKRSVNTTLDAQMSMPFSVAVALVKGNAGLEHFLPQALGDKAVQAAMRRIELVIDPDMSSAERPRVELVTTTGHRHVLQLEEALGGPSKPVSDQQLHEKFASMVSLAGLDSAEANALLGAVEKLETLDDAAATLARLATVE